QVSVGGKNLEGKDLVKWKYQRYMQDYLACVQGVDDSVGQILDYLDKNDLAKNTVVIYTADNGWYLGEFGLYDKRFMYEPGLRTPLLARGPGIANGWISKEMVMNIDLAPTFLGLAGITPPESMQGKSLVQLLKGQVPDNWRPAVYYRYYHDPGHHNTRAHYGVRTGTHKLIYYWKKDAYELFDLVQDPLEQRNLLGDPATADAPSTRSLFEKLKTQLGDLQKQYGDDGRYADPVDWPKGGVDGPFNEFKPLGKKSVAEAIGVSVSAARN
ncbi:MAG: Choline-sulfatase, partial [Planctomycetota bacterium]